MRFVLLIILLLLLLGALMVRCVAMAHETAFSAGVLLPLNIPSQPIGKALNEFARQSGIQVVFYSALEGGLISPVLAGKYTPNQALDILLWHSGLRYEYLNKSTVAVVRLQADDVGIPRLLQRRHRLERERDHRDEDDQQRDKKRLPERGWAL